MSAVAYLDAVIGPDETTALLDLAPEGLTTSRTALAWLQQRSSHKGSIPGTDVDADIVCDIDGWSGQIQTTEWQLTFSAQSDTRTAACIATAVGAATDGTVNNRVAMQLGRSLDRLIASNQAVILDAVVPTIKKPVEPPKQPAPKAPKARKIKVESYTGHKACEICGKSWSRDGVSLTGCHCWAGMLATAGVVRLHSGWLVTPGRDWGQDGILAFVEACSGQ